MSMQHIARGQAATCGLCTKMLQVIEASPVHSMKGAHKVLVELPATHER